MSAPTVPTGHDEYEPMAVAWAIAALEPDEQARFEAHRESGCARCAAAVAEAMEVGLELAFAVPDVEPPPSLRGRVLDAAARMPRPRLTPERPAPDLGQPWNATSDAAADSGRTPVGPPRACGDTTGPDGPREVRASDGRHRVSGPRGVTRRRLVAALAAAALVGVSAVTTWQVVGRDAGSSTSVPGSRVAALSASDGSTVATVVFDGGRADVVTDSLRPNADRNTHFVLWGVPSGGAGTPKALGSFVVTADDLHSYSVRLERAAGDYPVYAVSEEPDGALPVAPSSVLARGAVNR